MLLTIYYVIVQKTMSPRKSKVDVTIEESSDDQNVNVMITH